MTNSARWTDEVPLDVLKYVFAFLNVRDLGVVSEICKLWNRASSEDQIWKLQYEKDKIPYSFKEGSGRSWKEHYRIHAAAMKMNGISWMAGSIYSAWGSQISVWSKVWGNPPLSLTRTPCTQNTPIMIFRVYSVGISTLVFTGSPDGSVKIWKNNLGSFSFRFHTTLEGMKEPITAIERINQHFAFADASGKLHIWKQPITPVESYKKIKVIDAHKTGIVSLSSDRTGSEDVVISASSDRTIKVWRIRKDSITLDDSLRSESENGDLTCMTTGGKVSRIFVGYASGKIDMFERNPSYKYLRKQTICTGVGKVKSILVDLFKNRLLVSGSEGKLKSWTYDAKKGQIGLEESVVVEEKGPIFSLQTTKKGVLIYATASKITYLSPNGVKEEVDVN